MRLWSIHPRYLDAQGLVALWREARSRGYAFDAGKIGPLRAVDRIAVTRGQIEYEWRHLLAKLALRSPAHYRRWRHVRVPECHPLVRRRPGRVEPWERHAP
jgi:hypothetical protein